MKRLPPALLVPLLSHFSQAVNSSVASSRSLALAMQVASLQRLRDLRSAAPRVRATLDKVNVRLPNGLLRL